MDSENIERLRHEIIEALFNNDNTGIYSEHSVYHSKIDEAQFPELILLNKKNNDRPVFWIHSVGGVQPYFMIAKHIARPFYGIEARGWRTDRAPLYGIQAAAAYYIHIMKSVQPVGPYDLGGYSLGGLIAYEVTRQLQELGDHVQTITMLDTLAPNVLGATKDISVKCRLLQAANFILATQVFVDTANIKKFLINCNEVDWSMSVEDVTRYLGILVKDRGIDMPDRKLHEKINKWGLIQQAYEYGSYKIGSLLKPEHVRCNYFRNKSGLFFGELAPCYSIPGDEVEVDHINYWKLWQDNLPNMQIIDVEASNHLMLLSEKSAYETIIEFCCTMYNEPQTNVVFSQIVAQSIEK